MRFADVWSFVECDNRFGHDFKGRIPGQIAEHPDVTVNHTQISRMVQKIDTDKMHQLFYESHKEVDKIAEVIGKNFNSKLIAAEYESGLTPEQIATNHNLDEALVWAILLEGKNDLVRLEELTTTREGH